MDLCTTRAPIRVSDFEAREGTRYTVDTLALLLSRHRRDRFIWLAGADIVAELHRWRRWRTSSRTWSTWTAR